jgi:lysophospholipase L1-like esterase
VEVAVSRLGTFAISLGLVLGLGLSAVYRHPVPVRHDEVLTLGAPLNHIAVVGDSLTNGTDEGGQGSRAWTARAWQRLARQGLSITPVVAAEGRAGYEVTGDHGSTFQDLTERAVHPDDALVVFFGSRNDEGVDPELLGQMALATFELAHRTAPSARLLVIGPPWPTADVPQWVLMIRDVLNAEASVVGASFVDPIADHWLVGRPDLIGPDGVHPNDAGHAYLADKIAPLIGAQLPRRV